MRRQRIFVTKDFVFLVFMAGMFFGLLIAALRAEAMPREPDLPSMFEMNCYTAAEGDREFHTCRFGRDVIVLFNEQDMKVWRLVLSDYDQLPAEFVENAILLMYEQRGRWLLGFDPTEQFREACEATRWAF